MPKAIKVTEENIEFIIWFGQKVGMNLDHIKDNYEYNAEDGFETYLITDGTPRKNNVTFTDKIAPDFFSNWKFTTGETPNEFAEIERI